VKSGQIEEAGAALAMSNTQTGGRPATADPSIPDLRLTFERVRRRVSQGTTGERSYVRSPIIPPLM
jgi:hypothetical protein